MADSLPFATISRRQMKGSDYIADFLARQGVTHVFEVSGGMIAHLLDSIHNQGKITLVSMHHEQGAAFAAEATARITGIPAVAIATSGPGAINLLTGIGSCYFDSVPAVFITGQVNRNEQKNDLPVRQLGFQEADIVAMVTPITKQTWKVESVDQLPAILESAFRIALSGRPGPVLIDIPMDVQRLDLTPPLVVPIVPDIPAISNSEVIEQMLDDLRLAARPVILVGGGVRAGRATNQFRVFVDKLKVPVVHSLMASDVLPHDHESRIGLIGTYGNRWANLATGKSDFLIVIGSRLDIRQTGADTDAFRGNKKIYQIDLDAGEVNNRVKGCIPIFAHVQKFLDEALKLIGDGDFERPVEWFDEILTQRKLFPDTSELAGCIGINPNIFMHHLSEACSNAAAYVLDCGAHQMWAAQSLDVGADQRVLITGGMGSMGFGLPAAIGTAIACPERPVVMICGDGGLQHNIQELQTIVRNQLPIKIVVMNNECHGMVRQFQDSYFGSRYQSTVWGYSAPDFCAVARSYGIESGSISESDQLDSSLQEIWSNGNKPFLLNVPIDKHTNIHPKLAFGRPITEMEPFVDPIPMEPEKPTRKQQSKVTDHARS